MLIRLPPDGRLFQRFINRHPLTVDLNILWNLADRHDRRAAGTLEGRGELVASDDLQVLKIDLVEIQDGGAVERSKRNLQRLGGTVETEVALWNRRGDLFGRSGLQRWQRHVELQLRNGNRRGRCHIFGARHHRKGDNQRETGNQSETAKSRRPSNHQKLQRKRGRVHPLRGEGASPRTLPISERSSLSAFWGTWLLPKGTTDDPC